MKVCWIVMKDDLGKARWSFLFRPIASLKGALSGLRQFLATEDPFKNNENAFYYTLKAFSALKIFIFFVLTFSSCRKKVWLERYG